MLTAHHLSKSFSIHTILADISFSLLPGERLGLIGPNGCGKTTLMQILAGLEKPDKGTITLSPPGLRLGYLPQGLSFAQLETISQCLAAILGDPDALQADLERRAAELASAPDRPELLSAYQSALTALESFDPARLGRTEAILAVLGLADIDRDQPIGQLSGGQKTRLGLARVLIGDPQVLLLDEPTNHLDIHMLEWLEDWLAEFSGAALIVSHDRTFLDRTVNRILDLDPLTHNVSEYTGNYSAYLEQYQAAQMRLWQDYQDQVYEIRRMQQDINRTRQQAAWVEQTTTSRQPGVRAIAKKVARKAKSREKKLERYLDADERLDKPKAGWQMKLAFGHDLPQEGEVPHLGQDVLRLEGVAVGYPGTAPLLEGLDLQALAGRRIVLTGPNGSGKTTLMRTIAGELAPVSGRVRLGASVRLGYMAQEQEGLDPQRNSLQEIQLCAPLNETEARSFLHYFLFSEDDPLRPTAELSYGERARLMLARLVVQGCNLLLLDEPVNHLDIPSRERFEQALAQFSGTILAVVHDRFFIERFATDRWHLEGRSIRTEVIVS